MSPQDQPSDSRGRRLTGISPVAWEHPADREALEAMKKVPGFELVTRRLFSNIGDEPLRLTTLASAVRAGEGQLPELHGALVRACDVLDVATPPELYVTRTPIVDAGTIGVRRPFIVLTTELLELFQEDELPFVVGRQLGHVLSGHAPYRTVLRVLLRLEHLTSSIPLGTVALLGVVAAFLNWDRKSEYSADRAGLLVAGSPEPAREALMKLTAGSRAGEVDADGLREQAAEYAAAGRVGGSVTGILNLLGQSHPFPILRLAELNRWVADGGHESILDGEYPTRRERPATPPPLPPPRDPERDSEEPESTFLTRMLQQLGSEMGKLGDRLR